MALLGLVSQALVPTQPGWGWLNHQAGGFPLPSFGLFFQPHPVLSQAKELPRWTSVAWGLLQHSVGLRPSVCTPPCTPHAIRDLCCLQGCFTWVRLQFCLQPVAAGLQLVHTEQQQGRNKASSQAPSPPPHRLPSRALNQVKLFGCGWVFFGHRDGSWAQLCVPTARCLQEALRSHAAIGTLP